MKTKKKMHDSIEIDYQCLRFDILLPLNDRFAAS